MRHIDMGNKHQSPIYALFYYTDCQIATLDYFVWKKSSAKNETRRHYDIAWAMLAACEQFALDSEHKIPAVPLSVRDKRILTDAFADLKRRFADVECTYRKTPAGQEK